MGLTAHKPPNTPFDDDYFRSGPYANVSFARFSQYWWSNRFYAKLANRYGPKQGRVLEIGCGLGHLLHGLSGRYQVFGMDINPWALSKARLNVPQGQFACMSTVELNAFPDNSFQVVIAKHVLEHIINPKDAVAEISRILVHGGFFLMATPNLDSPMRNRKKGAWIGYKDPTHISLRTPEVWLGYLRENGLEPRRIFSDGFWDAPYVPYIPNKLQKLLFGLPGGFQAILGRPIIPLKLGESVIIMADKPA